MYKKKELVNSFTFSTKEYMYILCDIPIPMFLPSSSGGESLNYAGASSFVACIWPRRLYPDKTWLKNWLICDVWEKHVWAI